jgi:hypothetical protein
LVAKIVEAQLCVVSMYMCAFYVFVWVCPGRLRMELERRKSIKATTSNVEYIDPKAEAEAESMAKLLLEEDEKENKQGRGGSKKSKKKKR